MDRSLAWIRGLGLILALLAVVGWMIYRVVRRSSDSAKSLLIKSGISGLILLVMLFKLVPALFSNGLVGAAFLPYLAAGAIILSLLWAPIIGDWVSVHFESIFTGGDSRAEVKPLYSMAEAKRKQGQFDLAAKLVREQLAHFPRDAQGHWMLADIYARDLHDLESAAECLRRFGETAELPADQFAATFHLLADYYFDLGHDVDLARQALREIADHLPGTPQASRAEERLAHWANVDPAAMANQREPVALSKGPENLGLRPAPGPPSAKEEGESSRREAEQLAEHLEANPHDHTARERLALLYADHYGALDMAIAQMEILAHLEDAPNRQRVHWLNLLADIQTRHKQDYEVICGTLNRIIALNPGGAAAEQARQRMGLLKLSLRAHTKSRTISLDHKAPEQRSAREEPPA